MGMDAANLLLALGMFLSGTLNTIAAKFAQQTFSTGKCNKEFDAGSGTYQCTATTVWGSLDGNYYPDDTDQDKNGAEHRHAFDHPFVLAAVMFCGEALCLAAWLIKKEIDKRHSDTAALIEKPSDKLCTNSIYFSIPAMLDMCGTGVMNAGLCLTYASVFQMLRSAVVVFTAFFSIVLLKRKLYVFHWVSIALVVAGVTVVGYVSIYYTNKEEEDKDDDSSSSNSKSASSVMLGNFLVILAQMMVAFQMVIEEKIINKYGAPALKAVGFEGLFGFLILGILLIPLYFIHVNGYPIEDAEDAMLQISNSTNISLGMSGYVLSIAFFNFFGISVTKAMSASHRMVLDSLRTCAVLVVSILLGWETFHYEQLFGFALLLLGTALYNEILQFKSIFSYGPEEGEQRERLSSFADNIRQDSKDLKSGMASEPLLANV